MINPIYERQESLRLNVPDTVSVVGCGGTGWWTAFFLAMSGVQNLILVDKDNLEPSNMNRIPIFSIENRTNKVDLLERKIRAIRPGVRVEKHRLMIENEQDCGILRGVIFCCTDNLESQRLINAYAKKNKMRYQRIGYDGTFLNVSSAFPLTFDEKKEDAVQEGYTVTPSWVVPAVIAAGLGVASQMKEKIMYMDDLSNITAKGSSFVSAGIRKSLLRKGEDLVIEDPSAYDLVSSDYQCDECTRCDDCNRCDDCEYYSPDQYNDGVNESHDAGYDDGHEDGYSEGVVAGREEAKNEQ